MQQPNELWTIDQVAEYLGASSTGSARKTLSRWGVTAYDHRIDSKGRAHSLYVPATVRAAKAARPGRGTRAERNTHE